MGRKIKYGVLGVFIVTTAIVLAIILRPTPQPHEIVYGISPYQDTILPIVAEKKGWYVQEGLKVKLKVLPWGAVMNALASGSVDVAIQNFNSFQASYENINLQGGDVVFYYPLFVFKGAAIIIRGDGKIKPLSEVSKSYPHDREKAIMEIAKQLAGKTVITTKGTEMEQIVLAAIKKAGLNADKDVKIIHAEPDDGLNAFISGTGDAYSGGVTERTEASRHGAIIMLESADLNPPVIDGLVTTEHFARDHEEELLKLIALWYKTIDFMEKDLDENSKIVIEYLSTVSSTRYSVEEYKYTWFNTEVYPKNSTEMNDQVLSETALYYWKQSWNANNKFLLAEKKVKNPVPYAAFWGEEVHATYSTEYSSAKPK